VRERSSLAYVCIRACVYVRVGKEKRKKIQRQRENGIAVQWSTSAMKENY